MFLGFEDIRGLAQTYVGSSPALLFINKLYSDAFLCTLAPYLHLEYKNNSLCESNDLHHKLENGQWATRHPIVSQMDHKLCIPDLERSLITF